MSRMRGNEPEDAGLEVLTSVLVASLGSLITTKRGAVVDETVSFFRSNRNYEICD